MQTEPVRKGKETLVHWMMPLMLMLFSLLVRGAGEEAAIAFRYERQAVLDGELWRILSAHLAHLGWWHLIMNLAGLSLIWLLCGKAMTERLWWLMLVICSLGVSTGLLLFNPELQWYVGLSGILHGLLMAGAISGLLKRCEGSLLLLALVVVKLGWEQWQGPLPGSEAGAGGPVIVDAHLYGAITAALLMGMLLAIPAGRRQLLYSRRGNGN